MAPPYDNDDFITVDDISELESFSISKLVAYLKSEFRSEYYQKVEQILISREEKLKIEKQQEERKSNQLKRHAEDLEEELRACKVKCTQLIGMLEIKDRELECMKQRSERYTLLESRVAQLEKESALLVDLELERGRNFETFQGKVGNETDRGVREVRGVSAASSPKLDVKEQTLSSDGGVRDFAGCHSPVRESRGRQVEEPPAVNFLCKRFNEFKEEKKWSSSLNPSIGRSTSVNVIEISDSENESEGNSKGNVLNNTPLTKCSVQKAGEDSSSCGEKYPSVSTLKRRRMVMSSSDSENDHVSASDGPAVSTLKRKQRLKIVSNVGEDDHVNAPDSSDKQANFLIDPEEGKDDFAELISSIRRYRAKELKWNYEVDMISSFEEDPNLCMRAVCALYRCHVFAGKAMGGYLHSNHRGFDKFYEQRGTMLAKFLLGGDEKGELKKSVKELEMYDPRGLEECKRLAKYYSNQLFTIYQRKEDPLFP